MRRFCAANKVQGRQGQDPVAIEFGLEGEVEVIERFLGWESSGLNASLDSAFATIKELRFQQMPKKLQGTLALLSAVLELDIELGGHDRQAQFAQSVSYAFE